MKRTLIATGVMLLVLAGSARAVDTAAASFSFTKQKHGIPGKGSGTVTFRVDPAAKTFTCSLTGTGKLSGNATIYNIPQQITATLSLASTSCSGRYYPDQGTIDGNITVSGSYQSTATYRSTSGETESESNSGSESGSGTIYGNLGPGGSGVIDLGDGAMNFRMTRPLSGSAAAPPDPAPPAAPSATDRPAPPSARPTVPAPGSRPTAPPSDRPEPSAPPADPEPAAPTEEPEATEPQAAADDGDNYVVEQYVRDSVELSNTVMDEYKGYLAGGGQMNFSSYLRREYPDPAEREKAETAVRVAAEEKEFRLGQIDALMQTVDETAGEIINRYNNESVAPAAAGQGQAESFTGYLSRVISDREQRALLQQAVINSTVNSYERAREGYRGVVEKFSGFTDKARGIYNSITSGPGDGYDGWLKQKTADLTSGAFVQKARSMLPEAFVENADSYYTRYSGWNEKYDQAVQIQNTVAGLQERNRELLQQGRDGKLDPDGVDALRAFNVLEAGINSIPVPKGIDTLRDAMMGEDGVGKAVKATNTFLVYKTSVEEFSDELPDEEVKKVEDSIKALRVFGECKTHKPYNHENSFVTIYKSLKSTIWPESKPENLKYH